MTFILLGSKRVYMVLLFWQRVTNPRCALSRSLTQMDRELPASQLDMPDVIR